jgi:SAM-dependent methyltransferase
MQDADIKQAMRQRYDGFGKAVADAVEGMHGPGEVWRMAEGARPALAYYRRRKLETALRLGGFRAGAALLDVGCATADYTLLFARRGFHMTGADLSPVSIDTARRKAHLTGHDEMRFVVTDAETLAGVPDATFDGVVSFSALRYVPNLDRALAAIHRVLKPAGVVVLDVPNRYCPWFKLLKNRVGVETHFHDHHYAAGEIRRRLGAAGFADLRTRHLLYTSYLTPARLLPAFRLVDRIGERLPLFSRTAAILMARGVKA